MPKKYLIKWEPLEHRRQTDDDFDYELTFLYVFFWGLIKVRETMIYTIGYPWNTISYQDQWDKLIANKTAIELNSHAANRKPLK